MVGDPANRRRAASQVSAAHCHKRERSTKEKLLVDFGGIGLEAGAQILR